MVIKFLIKKVILICMCLISFSSNCLCTIKSNNEVKTAYNFLCNNYPENEFSKNTTPITNRFLTKFTIYKFSMVKWKGYGVPDAYYVAVSHDSEKIIVKSVSDLNNIIRKEELYIDSAAFVWEIVKVFFQISYHGPGITVLDTHSVTKIPRNLEEDMRKKLAFPKMERYSDFYSIKFYTIENIFDTITYWALAIRNNGEIEIMDKKILYQKIPLKL